MRRAARYTRRYEEQQMSHAWHDVEIGAEAPQTVHAVIEIPKHC